MYRYTTFVVSFSGRVFSVVVGAYRGDRHCVHMPAETALVALPSPSPSSAVSRVPGTLASSI